MDEIMDPTQPSPEDATGISAKDKKRHAEFRQFIETNKHYKRKLVSNWTTNIDYRRGKPFASQSDDDQIAVNMDWSFTKTKHAALFSQVPKARINHTPESVAAPWVGNFERKLNDTLRAANVESAMSEVMPDCINAAGIGVVLAAMESITEDKEVPAIDVSIFPLAIQEEVRRTGMLFGEPIPMTVVPEIVDRRYTVRRISPSDLLWPIEFTGSDFDNAPWIGHTGRITWAEAVYRFKLTEEDKQEVLTDERTIEDKLSHDYDKEKNDNGMVGFDELFYHEHLYDSESRSYSTIRHMVFLHGKVDPVIDQVWEGQKVVNGAVIGSMKKPLRVLTLAYISDECIPPSDSAIGRAQVNELNKGRTHIHRQRERSIPTDWFDVNRLDPSIQQALMRGTWQRAVPVQGDGTRIIGQVQRSMMPQDNMLFDKIAKQDLQEQWTIGGNQIGTGDDVETKGESNVIQSNFMTKVGMERAKVASFFVGIAQVVAGYLCLYEDPKSFGEGFDPKLSSLLDISILADSTVLLDSAQRLERLNKFVDMYGKSGWVNLEPVLKEIASLSGLDPAVIKAPEPEKPAVPSISLRLTGSEDMSNPLMLALLLASGQAPTPELIEQAKQLIQQSVTMPQPPAPPGMPPGMPTPDGVTPAPPPGTPLPQPAPPPVGSANPEMSLMPTIGKRAEIE
jgi:hypothetical protein